MTTGLPFIPVGEPEIADADRRRVLECLDSGWLSGEGPHVAEFEQALASRVARQHGIAVASGSSALDCAFAALNLDPGDEVIMPAFTIISCAAAVVRAGGVPVTVDCDPFTWTMAPHEVADRIGPRTRAILIVHIYGLPADADPILDLARARGLWVVEDAAEVIGHKLFKINVHSECKESVYKFQLFGNLEYIHVIIISIQHDIYVQIAINICFLHYKFVV